MRDLELNFGDGIECINPGLTNDIEPGEIFMIRRDDVGLFIEDKNGHRWRNVFRDSSCFKKIENLDTCSSDVIIIQIY